MDYFQLPKMTKKEKNQMRNAFNNAISKDLHFDTRSYIDENFIIKTHTSLEQKSKQEDPLLLRETDDNGFNWNEFFKVDKDEETIETPHWPQNNTIDEELAVKLTRAHIGYPFKHNANNCMDAVKMLDKL